MNSCQALLEALQHHNYEALKTKEITDLDNEMANIMPKVYFSTCFQLHELKKKFKLKGSL